VRARRHPFSVLKARSRPVLAMMSLVAALAAAGCTVLADDSEGDPTAARQFDEFPLYWVGERFERWDLTYIELDSPADFVTFIYGTCTPSDGEQPSCTAPLQIQLSPLCAHLDVVARAPIWKRRSIRGAPVGTIDSAPVLFARGAQVKVYRGEGSDPGLPLRALRALRSVNRVPPVIGPTRPIPARPPVYSREHGRVRPANSKSGRSAGAFLQLRGEPFIYRKKSLPCLRQ
jgi:hypothetical protein